MLTMADEARILEVDGVALELRVVRKRVKNINARLRGSTLWISAPHRVPAGELDETILQLARRLVRRSRADVVNSDGGAETIARKAMTPATTRTKTRMTMPPILSALFISSIPSIQSTISDDSTP